MNINKIIIMSSIVLMVLIILVPTSYKVIKMHHEKLYNVVNTKIINSVKKCYDDNICKEDTITLKFLYENNYLEKVSDPVTKEIYNENSYIIRKGNNYEFVVVF